METVSFLTDQLLFQYIILGIFKQFSIAALVGLIVVIILIVLSALISGSEIAFFSLKPSHIEELESIKSKRNKTVLSLLEQPKRLLATILIANNFVNVSIVIISTFIVSDSFDFKDYFILGFIVEVIIITGLILLFGEIMPKIYASQNAVGFSGFMAIPLKYLKSILNPFNVILVRSTSIIDKRLVKKTSNISKDELSEAIDITANPKETPEDIKERKILKGIVKFGDIYVKEIMKARIDVTAVDIETYFNDLIATVLDSGFSRIPVYSESFDNIKGIIHIKDLLQYLEEKEFFDWDKVLRPAYFVPENKKIDDLLKEFQEKKIHLAIVVDEYGGTSGIVTFEDVIEEIVGEISDEFDKETDEFIYSKIGENKYVFEGKTSLNDFIKIVKIKDYFFDDDKGESDTIAGLILELEGKIPNKNQIINYRNLIFEILSVDSRRIKRIMITINRNE